MPETNGSGRLERIEALLVVMGEKLYEVGKQLDQLAKRQQEFQVVQEHDHERFTNEAKQLLTWQVLMQGKMDRWAEEAAAERQRLNTLYENTDKRIADLVAAIGKLIEPKR